MTAILSRFADHSPPASAMRAGASPRRPASRRSCASRARPLLPPRSRSTPTPDFRGRCSPSCFSRRTWRCSPISLAPELARRPIIRPYLRARGSACARRLLARLAARLGDRAHLDRPHRHGPHARLRPQICERFPRHPSRPHRPGVTGPGTIGLHARARHSNRPGQDQGEPDRRTRPWAHAPLRAADRQRVVALAADLRLRDRASRGRYPRRLRARPPPPRACHAGIPISGTPCASISSPNRKPRRNCGRSALDRSDVRRIVKTHLHIDHDGGLEAFPASEILVSPASFRGPPVSPAE